MTDTADRASPQENKKKYMMTASPEENKKKGYVMTDTADRASPEKNGKNL